MEKKKKQSKNGRPSDSKIMELVHPIMWHFQCHRNFVQICREEKRTYVKKLLVSVLHHILDLHTLVLNQ